MVSPIPVPTAEYFFILYSFVFSCLTLNHLKLFTCVRLYYCWAELTIACHSVMGMLVVSKSSHSGFDFYILLNLTTPSSVSLTLFRHRERPEIHVAQFIETSYMNVKRWAEIMPKLFS